MLLLRQVILYALERIFYKEYKNWSWKLRIRDEKLRYHINREATKISAASLGKLINMNTLQVKIYYLLIEDIIEQAKFKYSPLRKTLVR